MAGRSAMIRYTQLRYRGGGSFRPGRYRGDPGFLGSLGKAIGGIAKVAGKVALPLAKSLPGIGTAISVGGLALKGVGIAKSFLGPKGKPPAGAGGAAFNSGLMSLGGPTITMTPQGQAMVDETRRQAGLGRRRYRRMNPLNPKAANRAIRRIKAVRKLVRGIESSLPKRAAPRARPAFGRKR